MTSVESITAPGLRLCDSDATPSLPAASFAVIEKSFAAIVLAVCVVMLLRMVIGERRRHRMDAAALRLWYGLRRQALRAWNWWPARRKAARMADEAIRRAQADGEWDGNVYRPRSFRKPRKPH